MRFTKRPELSMKIMAVPGCPGGVIPEGGVDPTQLEIIKEMFKYRCGIVLTFPGDPEAEADVRNAQFMLGRYVYELLQIYGSNQQVKVMDTAGDVVEPIEPYVHDQLAVEDQDNVGLYIDFIDADGAKVTVIGHETGPEDVDHERFFDADDMQFLVDPNTEFLVAKNRDGQSGIVNPLKYNVVIYLKSALSTPVLG